jgi:dCTP deaminase
MIASGQTLRELRPVEPFREPGRAFGRSYGVSHAGYDICLDQDVWLWPKGFRLASAMERFDMPAHLLGVVHDKSTNIRLGIAVHNTVIEPNWRGFLTLEISNQSWWRFHRLRRGTPIAQVIFHMIDKPVEGYVGGKYQDQARGPQKAILEAP